MKKRITLVVAALIAVPFCAASKHQPNQGIPAKATVVQITDSDTRVATWTNKSQHHYAIDQGDGNWHRVNQTSYLLRLNFSMFDPLEGVPAAPDNLHIPEPELNEGVFVVQFITQPLEEYRQEIQNLGGTIYKYLAHHSYLVRLNPESRAAVEQLPYVRWVGSYEPAYKLEAPLLAGVQQQAAQMPATEVNIMVFERGLVHKNIVAQRIADIGGLVTAFTPDGFRIKAILDGPQLVEIAALPEVMWIDIATVREIDMDIAREIGGANYVNGVAGFSGEGVRAEVMDSNLFNAHADFQAVPPIFHGPRSGSDDHGTGTYGINFGDGTANALGTGMVPQAQGIFADFELFTNRYQHTAELVQSPYFAVYQSNSWGGGRTTAYTSVSAEMDDIIFINDIIITQSQSNAGSRNSRPQAWAKNIVSVGGVHHQNTLTKADDFWQSASIGPAADGRIKPDLTHFYDSIFTTDDTQNGYRQFGGTSGATPIVAGHFGLFFQMWSEGIFGNEVDINGTVFENRPHAATAKAMLINHACSYPFNGTNANLTRTHQGWGLPDLQRTYDLRDELFIVNEDVVLENLDTASFDLVVEAQTPELRATMVYADTMGTTSSNQHRINDLSLKVTSPGGTVYWGNNGLNAGNFSTSGGSSNTIDTVENVFVQNPQAGTWTVDVIASEINEDSHVETSDVDADFALVVSGVLANSKMAVAADNFGVTIGSVDSGGLPELADSDDQYLVLDPVFLTFRYQIQFTVDSTSPTDTPSELEFSYESRAFNFVGTVDQEIELFNYVSGSFETIDTRLAAVVDTVVTVIPGGDASRFVQAGTGAMQARINYQNSTPFWVFSTASLYLPYRVRADHVFWSITP